VSLHVAYVGNFSVSHSTETHIGQALEACDHKVTRLQENAFAWNPGEVPSDTDFVLWTHTADYGPPQTYGDQRRFLAVMRRRGISTVGYHLDKWWDLDREHRVHESPFFECDLVCTADGGNDDRWEEAGVRHSWFAPAVSEFECVPAEPADEYRSEIAFVGSWRSYHGEHSRLALVEYLRNRFGDRVRFWPRPNQPAVRGEALRRLYASVAVAVGDSCLVPRRDGTPLRAYISDRVPESLGRGAFLVHPHVDGVMPDLYEDGHHLVTFPLGDFVAMGDKIEHYLANPEQRRLIAECGRAHVLERHTYTVRMRELATLLAERGMLRTDIAA